MNNRYLNMDIVRYILSTAVIIAHFNILSQSDIPFPINSGCAVGVFFGISGYLVYGSYLKHKNLKNYIKSRAKRILPPYIFIVLSCAIGLFAISNYSAINYFTSISFWKYLLSNIFFLNFLQPSLPGVFEQGVTNAVNGSLWTLKVEWGLYLSIPVFFWGTRKYKWNILYAIFIICICSFIYSYLTNMIGERLNISFFNKMSYQFVGQLAYFYTGVLIFHYKEYLSYHKWWLMLPVTIIIFAIIEKNIFNIDFTYISFICPMLLVFGALLLSLSTPISQHSSILGNVSYEMYLFHFPVIQLAVYYGLGNYLPKYYFFLVTLTIIIILSIVYQKTYKWFERSLNR